MKTETENTESKAMTTFDYLDLIHEPSEEELLAEEDGQETEEDLQVPDEKAKQAEEEKFWYVIEREDPDDFETDIESVTVFGREELPDSFFDGLDFSRAEDYRAFEEDDESEDGQSGPDEDEDPGDGAADDQESAS